MEKLRTYVKNRGLTKDSPPKLLEAARREHRRLYLKEYQANYDRRTASASPLAVGFTLN